MFLRFLLVGGTGFLIDAGLTWCLAQAAVAPWLARIPAIAAAVAFTWLANRRYTYRVGTRRTAGEALRYAGVAGAMALFNYAVYLALVGAGMPLLPAVVCATACQTLLSFHAYRRFVFR